MKRKTIITQLLALLLVVMSLLVSCVDIEKEEFNLLDSEGNEIDMADVVSANRYYMKRYYEDYFPIYFWYDDVKQRVSKSNYNSYLTIFEYFDATLYDDDRWSWILTGDEYRSIESGEMTGTLGISLGQAIEYYNDYDIRVRYIYPGSPLEKFGVSRGWVLTHLDSVSVVEYILANRFEQALLKTDQLFTFEDLQGRSHTFRASPVNTLSTRSSLKVDVFKPDDYPGLTEPVGYFLYMSFMQGKFLNDIKEAMAQFKSAGVKKVILDLRYNSGGDGEATDLMFDYLAPESADKKIYHRMVHNRTLSYLNKNDTIHRNEGSLDLDALYVIGGEYTASASEVLINGLKPYLDLYLVGDTTYGKPNGMYVLYYPNSSEDRAKYKFDDFSSLKLVFLPIAFFNKNSEDAYIPYMGFVPDNYCPDDLYHDFGLEENNVKACLEHIVSGSFPPPPSPYAGRTKASAADGWHVIDDDIIGNNPLYGKTILPLPELLRKGEK